MAHQGQEECEIGKTKKSKSIQQAYIFRYDPRKYWNFRYSCKLSLGYEYKIVSKWVWVAYLVTLQQSFLWTNGEPNQITRPNNCGSRVESQYKNFWQNLVATFCPFYTCEKGTKCGNQVLSKIFVLWFYSSPLAIFS